MGAQQSSAASQDAEKVLYPQEQQQSSGSVSVRLPSSLLVSVHPALSLLQQ
jgi:hypothetical protein